ASVYPAATSVAWKLPVTPIPGAWTGRVPATCPGPAAAMASISSSISPTRTAATLRPGHQPRTLAHGNVGRGQAGRGGIVDGRAGQGLVPRLPADRRGRAGAAGPVRPPAADHEPDHAAAHAEHRGPGHAHRAPLPG